MPEKVAAKRVLAASWDMLAFVASPVQARIAWSHVFDAGFVPNNRVWCCGLGGHQVINALTLLKLPGIPAPKVFSTAVHRYEA